MGNLNLDIHSFLQTATILALVGFIYLFLRALKLIRNSADLPYFRLRREQLVNGWRVLGISIALGVAAVLVNVFGEPVVYRFYPITVTPTATQTVTLIPTVTLSPTITVTPSVTPTLEFTYTPTVTSTPHIPLSISAQFESVVTPGPNVVFSSLEFSKGYDDDFFPIQPGTVFQNPVGHLYALFSYDGMLVGSQWTALWYRQGILVHFETQPWDGNTGGFGFSDWDPPPAEWTAGNYEVQIFVGMQWVTTGVF
ncbi:MAG: hypothetical protein N2C13_01430, partial [Chloroflexota bacterium]